MVVVGWCFLEASRTMRQIQSGSQYATTPASLEGRLCVALVEQKEESPFAWSWFQRQAHQFGWNST
eukprot:10912199-Karenia_brevis.AAC.1